MLLSYKSKLLRRVLQRSSKALHCQGVFFGVYYINNALDTFCTGLNFGIRKVAMKISVRRILVVLFGDVALSDRIGVAQSLNKATKNLFNGGPAILPIPDDAPLEIPRIILRSKDENFVCHVSSKSLEFSLKQKKGENKRLKEIQDDFLSQLADLARVVKTGLRVKVERLGVVINSAMFLEEPSTDFLIKRFLKEGIVIDPREVNLSFLHKFALGGFKVNRWQRFSCVSPKDEGTLEGAKVLHIETDVNTVPEIKYDFSAEAIPSFCSQVFTFTESDLESLFAKED
jgi:hypothetical protein